MMERLIAALGKQGLTVEEIADAIWLASQMQQAAQESSPIPLDNPILLPTVNRPVNIPLNTEPSTPPISLSPINPPPPSNPKDESPPSNPQTQTSQVGIYAQQKGSAAVPFKVPDAPSLREPLNLARAMRELMRRVPSTTSTAVLDEAATTQRIAEEGIWIPVLKPTVEPWLEVALVVDESESMLIWRHTVVEFQRLLEHYGGFRDVRTWGLFIDNTGKVKIRSGIGLVARNQCPRSPKELIEPNGRRLILIASDCIAKIWQNETVLDALKIWAESGQVAIVQMLPQYMWEKTALGLATEVLFRTLEAGVPNQRLLVKQLSAWDDIDLNAGIKVPVVTLEPEKLSKWAQMVTGRSDIWTLGYVFEGEPVDESFCDSVDSTTELLAEKRLQRFRVTASPMARKLAVLLAAAPVICLPVVRIIQAQMLPESRQVHVAEVFLGGLLTPLSEIRAETNPDSVEYDFMPGVRDILLESIPALDSLDVFGKVSEFVANRLGVSLAEFAAVLKNPAQAKDEKVAVAEKVRPFAKVTAQILKRMGGEYGRIAEQLERQVAGDAMPKRKSAASLWSLDRTNFDRNIAVVIGIDNYQNGVQLLETAVNDARAIADLLEQEYEYQEVIRLFPSYREATLAEIKELLFETLPNKIKPTDVDRLIFYFAGHGIAWDSEYGPAGYLIPQDALLGKVETFLSTQKLNEALSQLDCHHLLVILDCCFPGNFRWSSSRDVIPPAETIHREHYEQFIRRRAWQVITSAAHNQQAIDFISGLREDANNSHHSPFALALIEGLKDLKADLTGDGVITATELYLYLRDRLLSKDGYSELQTPKLLPLLKHDGGEFIFTLPNFERDVLKPAPPLDASTNPYRGLASFEEEHSKLFFGRTEVVEKLQKFVKNHSLTVVLGASGSGKSSLVKAGLISWLRKETAEQWSIFQPIRPGETPLQALNNVLKGAQLPKIQPQNPQQNLAQSIDVWAKRNPNPKLLLFIDQCEEIITLCPYEDERKEFFQQILTAIDAHWDKLRVVLSLRSDFESQIKDVGFKFVPESYSVKHTELKNRWLSGRFIVPALTRGELREAIEKPAQARVMFFQPPELVEQLIDEVADMPGALPLLSFTLSELYLKYLKRQREAQIKGKRIERALVQADYQDLGGVILSLTQRADEEYEALVKKNPAYTQIIRQVLLRMVALGGGELARRQVPLWELEYPPDKNYLVKAVIERFTNARLLVKGEDAEGNFYVEPAHDALVRDWQRLLKWMQQEKESLLLQRRLTPAAMEWKATQDAGFLWNNSPYLDLLKQVLNSDDNWLNQVETEFVQRSLRKKRLWFLPG
jgi:hypothetical protein